ncbi:Transforming growth factor-beta receptor-associated protein 1 [Hypsibius exemplaris]|uniref:Transforming growth factor-beta receptor-associated protein 1 n=1 Tax=Hypsibius exemplaris TaxID=2072580 RepID=A0A1W0WFI0_HYPEX|nr:Transforming growth factor-beta receptor-associated protein 1 [Hypsibius exemplaris]
MSVRTFDVAAVISALPPSNGNDTRIECMDYAAGHIFLGTIDGLIHRYAVHVSVSLTGRRQYHPRLVASKRIASKKAIVRVEMIDAMNRVLYLCDGVLGMLDGATVEIVPGGGAKVKGVLAFSLNDRIDPENPFISFEVCVVRKRQIAVFGVSESQLTLLTEIALPETPLEIVYSEPFVCFASSSEYQVINVKETSHEIHHLFPYPDLPVIASLTDSNEHEFLLSGPGGLGMFVSAQTLVAPRPPINWAELRVIRMHYSAPYILVFSREDIWVFSSINQQPKQSLQLLGCRSVCGALFEAGAHATPLMAADSKVWALENVPWQEQVDGLLEEKRVNEALQIARSYSDEDTLPHFRGILQRAALVQLHRQELRPAKELLLESECSPSFVLAFCPDLLPSADILTTSPFFIPIFNPHDPAAMNERNAFLIAYLEEYRRSSTDFTEEMNWILLKLFSLSEQNEGSILPFIKSFRNILPYEETVHLLSERRYLVALAFFQVRMCHLEKALTLMKDLVDNPPADLPAREVGVVTVSTIVDVLKSVEQEKLLLQTLPWLLKKDQSAGLQVLKHMSSNGNSSDVRTLLEGFPNVHRQYLEFLIFDKEIQKEQLYQELAVSYLTNLSELPSCRPDAIFNAFEMRTNLQTVLRSPLCTFGADIEASIEQLQLHEEKVILLAKRGEHLAALDLLASRLKDRAGAVQYCVQYGKRDKLLKRQLFEHLLAIYFNPREQNEESVRAALELLNDEEADFDPAKVLSMLPANWPLSCLEGFLSHTLRRSLHSQRTGAVERGLAKCLHFSAQLSTVGRLKDKILLTEERRCIFCKKPFLDCTFKRLTDGRLVHLHCHSSNQ